MNKLSPQQYDEILYKLPQEVRDVVVSMDTTSRLYKIGEKHKLQIDQIGIMHDITMDTMMGIIASKDIVDEISKNCNISKADAGLIVHDLDEEVFKPIKDLMMKLYSGGAPFKPATMQTVDETEEDHMNLDKTDILKEIEDPIDHEVKKTPVQNIPIKKIFYPTPQPASTGVEEYHTEISLGKKMVSIDSTPRQNSGQASSLQGSLKPKENSPTGISNIEESKKRLLESIASQKLSGVFTMPRISNEEVSSIPPKVVPQSAIAPKAEEVKKGVSGDPYREALK